MWSTVGRNRGGPSAAKPSTSVASGSAGGLPSPELSAPVPDTRKSKQVSCCCAPTAGVRIQSSVEGCSRTIRVASER